VNELDRTDRKEEMILAMADGEERREEREREQKRWSDELCIIQ